MSDDLEELEAEEREIAELLASGAIPEPPDDLTEEEATGWVFGYIAGYRQSIVDNA